MPVSVQIDDRQLKSTLKKLSKFPKEVPKAASAAINRTLTFTNKTLKKEVRNVYNIKAGDIQSSLTLKRATPSSLVGQIQSDGRRLTLGRFVRGASKRGKPVKVRVKKAATKVVNTAPGAFVSSLTGNKQVLKRKGKSRYPVEVLHTLSIPQMISTVKVSNVIQTEAQRVLRQRTEHEVNFRLSKLGG